MSNTLCVVSPGRLAVADGGRVQVDPKTVAGMQRYAATWPGGVHFVAQRGQFDTRGQPFGWPRPEDLPFDVSIVDDVEGAVRRLAPALVLAPLEVERAPLLDQATPCVLVCDFPLRVRWENTRLDPGIGATGTLRTAIGLARRAAGVRAMIRKADGLHCNGPDTFAAYGALSRSALHYMDTRVTSAQVASASGTGAPRDDVLRLAFSGRWIEQKGVLDAVAVTERLHADGVPVHLTLLGGGSLEQRLRDRAHAAVTVRGRLDFDSEWVPFVRDHVDVMVLPHPQGDSASTFLESMSSGTPVAGYANRYWSRLHAESRGGWTSQTADVGALAALLARLAQDADEVQRVRRAGLNFGAQHTFEAEFDRRVQHLRSVLDG